MTSLHLYSPSGSVERAQALRLAAKRLQAMGMDVHIDSSALARHQRFAGDDDTRLAALHRVASDAPSVAMATRGGYGMTRLLDRIDWPLLARSIERGTRWVGYSDLTVLQMGLLAHCKAAGRAAGAGSAGSAATSWAGPMATGDFGRPEADGGVDEVTRDCFLEAMHGELEAVGFRTEPGFDGLGVSGRLWGGNLAMLVSLLGTPHWPAIQGGVLFLEDINEHPFRIERLLLQLQQAGVLERQKAVVLGAFSGCKPTPKDRGFTLKAVVARLRTLTSTPVLTGLPFGHVSTKVTLPVGRKVQLLVQGRDALIGW
jgi:muramoyltetrapeptide carboxypeptidase